jgi:hypothetical protein
MQQNPALALEEPLLGGEHAAKLAPRGIAGVRRAQTIGGQAFGLEIEVRLDLGMKVRIGTAPSPPPAASRLTGRHSTQDYAPLLSRVNPRLGAQASTPGPAA